MGWQQKIDASHGVDFFGDSIHAGELSFHPRLGGIRRLVVWSAVAPANMVICVAVSVCTYEEQ